MRQIIALFAQIMVFALVNDVEDDGQTKKLSRRLPVDTETSPNLVKVKLEVKLHEHVEVVHVLGRPQGGSSVAQLQQQNPQQPPRAAPRLLLLGARLSRTLTQQTYGFCSL